MGFWDKFKDHIESIESGEDSALSIVWKYPRNNKSLKPGVKVTVCENQFVIMVHQMETGDAYGPGVHSLTMDKIPGLISTPTWNYGVNSAFKADAYFINHNRLENMDWRSSSPFNIIDPVAGLFEAVCSGTVSIRLVDPRMFFDQIIVVNKIVSEDSEIKSRIEALVSNDIIAVIEGLKDPANYLVNDTEGLAEQVMTALQNKYLRFGFRLSDIKFGLIELPPDVRSEMEQHAASQIKYIQLNEEIELGSSVIELDVPNQVFETDIPVVIDEVASVDEIIQAEVHEEDYQVSQVGDLTPEVIEIISFNDEDIADEQFNDDEMEEPSIIEMHQEDQFILSEELMSEEIPEAIIMESEPVVGEQVSAIVLEEETQPMMEADKMPMQVSEYPGHKYFVAVGAETKGPLTVTELLNLAVNGKIGFGSLAWRKGLEQWAVIESIPELKGLLEEVTLLIREGAIDQFENTSEVVQQGTISFESVESSERISQL